MMKGERRNRMSTPHNEAKKGEIAKIVLMPGDPLRAKYIAEQYLENYHCFNTVRNMLGYTGTYKGIPISVMGSGMGMPSMGIYAYELFQFYDVDVILRIGSSGAYDPQLNLFDVVLVEQSYSESTYAFVQSNQNGHIQYPSPEINAIIQTTAQQKNKKIIPGKVHSCDVFYHESEYEFPKDCLCVEMESYALFHTAHILHKKAACLLTISDSLVTHQETSSKERETALQEMMELALESVEKIYEI